MIPHIRRSKLGPSIDYWLWSCLSPNGVEGWGTTQDKAYAAWKESFNRPNQSLRKGWEWRTDYQGRWVLVR